MKQTRKAYDPVVNRTGAGYHGSPQGARGYVRNRGVVQEEEIVKVITRDDGYTLTITRWPDGSLEATITPKHHGRWFAEDVTEENVGHIIERFQDRSLFVTS